VKGKCLNGQVETFVGPKISYTRRNDKRLAIAAKFTVSGNSPVASKVKKRRIAATGQWAGKARSI
jgi:hypothetical protein